MKDLWMGSYQIVDASKLRAVVRSKVNEDAGLQEEREFRLDPKRPELTIRRRFTNASKKAVHGAFWERTLTPAGAVGFAPANPQSAFGPAGWAVSKDGKYSAGAATSANPSVKDGTLVVHTVGQGEGAYLDAVRGWMAARVGGLLFAVYFPVIPKMEYPWGQGLDEGFYYADDRLEIDSASPSIPIAPHRQVDWTVQWKILPFGDAAADDAHLSTMARKLAEQAMPVTAPVAASARVGRKKGGPFPSIISKPAAQRPAARPARA